jgi:glycosyltransferase involved in cell wall biosynthesis
MLFPIEWPEPFGLVMIEAMACGTPVIAWRRGSVPEVVDDGVTGYVVDTIDAAVGAVARIDALSRATCRRVFEQRFDAARMARDYVAAYRRVMALRSPARSASG